jgi:hypothetical protein
MATPNGLVDLITTTAPEASAQGGNVVVTAPAIVAGMPDAHGQVRLMLTIQQAELLMARLQPVVRIARQRFQQRN